jgi:hypothetical protein
MGARQGESEKSVRVEQRKLKREAKETSNERD